VCDPRTLDQASSLQVEVANVLEESSAIAEKYRHKVDLDFIE
jgi:hypothetical protein